MKMELTQKDLMTIVEQFSEAVHRSLSQTDNNEIVEKVVREFESNLKSSISVIPGIEQDEESQKIKSGIEEMEKKGREVKLELGLCRKEFRQSVYEEAKEQLIARRPKIDIPEIPTKPESLPLDYKKALKELGDNSDALIQELKDLIKIQKEQEKKMENIEHFFTN